MTDFLENSELQTPLDVFYSKKHYFSYSAINRLLWNPKDFYNYYILQQKEEKISENLIKGKLIHCLLLNNHELLNNFIISPANLPTGNNKLVIDKLFFKCKNQIITDDNFIFEEDLECYEQDILDILKEIDLHQSLKDDKGSKDNLNPKTGDEKRLEKIITEENKNYFIFLSKKQNKTLVDTETYNYCLEQVNLLKQDEEILKLLGLDVESSLDENIETFNEIELKMDLKDLPFGLKGILDNYVINHNIKKILVNDFKTTSKELINFKEAVEFYKYWLQAVIYIMLVGKKHHDLIYLQNYTVEFRFIVLNDKQQYYTFKVKDVTLNAWFDEYLKVITAINYHYTNKKYNLPYVLEKEIVEL